MCFFAAAGAAAGIGSAMTAISTVASIGIGIMQAAAAQQAAMADYQNKLQYRKEQETQNQKTLNQQVAQQQAALESQKDKAQGELADAAIQGAARESTAKVATAEAGVVGLSVDNLLGAIKGEEGRFKNRLSYNAKVGQFNAENELKMAQRGAQARLAEIPIPVKPVNTFGIDALGAIVGGLGQLGQLQSKGYV